MLNKAARRAQCVVNRKSVYRVLKLKGWFVNQRRRRPQGRAPVIYASGPHREPS